MSSKYYKSVVHPETGQKWLICLDNDEPLKRHPEFFMNKDVVTTLSPYEAAMLCDALALHLRYIAALEQSQDEKPTRKNTHNGIHWYLSWRSKTDEQFINDVRIEVTDEDIKKWYSCEGADYIALKVTEKVATVLAKRRSDQWIEPAQRWIPVPVIINLNDYDYWLERLDTGKDIRDDKTNCPWKKGQEVSFWHEGKKIIGVIGKVYPEIRTLDVHHNNGNKLDIYCITFDDVITTSTVGRPTSFFPGQKVICNCHGEQEVGTVESIYTLGKVLGLSISSGNSIFQAKATDCEPFETSDAPFAKDEEIEFYYEEDDYHLPIEYLEGLKRYCKSSPLLPFRKGIVKDLTYVNEGWYIDILDTNGQMRRAVHESKCRKAPQFGPFSPPFKRGQRISYRASENDSLEYGIVGNIFMRGDKWYLDMMTEATPPVKRTGLLSDRCTIRKGDDPIDVSPFALGQMVKYKLPVFGNSNYRIVDMRRDIDGWMVDMEEMIWTFVEDFPIMSDKPGLKYVNIDAESLQAV